LETTVDGRKRNGTNSNTINKTTTKKKTTKKILEKKVKILNGLSVLLRTLNETFEKKTTKKKKQIVSLINFNFCSRLKFLILLSFLSALFYSLFY